MDDGQSVIICGGGSTGTGRDESRKAGERRRSMDDDVGGWMCVCVCVHGAAWLAGRQRFCIVGVFARLSLVAQPNDTTLPPTITTIITRIFSVILQRQQ